MRNYFYCLLMLLLLLKVPNKRVCLLITSEVWDQVRYQAQAFGGIVYFGVRVRVRLSIGVGLGVV